MDAGGKESRSLLVSSRLRAVCVLSILLALLTPATAVTAQEPGKPASESAPVVRATAQDDPVDLAEALSSGRVGVTLRYRYETLDQAGFNRNAFASTLRTTLGYTTKPFNGFSIGLQAESVTDIRASDLHNNIGFGDRGNGIADRPVIADPPGTEMLQAYAQYEAGETLIKLGRQEITLDDHRFVGNVGFRQHHQSYRALWLGNDSLDDFSGHYAYVDRIYRITGARQDTGHHLINIQYGLTDFGNLTGYAYLLRYDDAGRVALSTDTFGGELKGRRAVGEDGHVLYELEYAHQGDAGNNPGRVGQDYLHLMAGGGYKQFLFRVGWEKLGGSEENGQFETPLATLHAFNGWADKFLDTPTNGLRDLYLRADGPAGPLDWTLAYHWFGAATGAADYGKELDFQVTYRAPWRQLFRFRGAVYEAEELATDTTKIWLSSTYSF